MSKVIIATALFLSLNGSFLYAGGENSKVTPIEVTKTLNSNVESKKTIKDNLGSQKVVDKKQKSSSKTVSKIESKLNKNKLKVAENNAVKTKLELDKLKNHIKELNNKNKKLREAVTRVNKNSDKINKKYIQVTDLYNLTKENFKKKTDVNAAVKNELEIKKQKLEDSIAENKKLKSDIKNLLSSDVDIWKVISNKTKILENFKRNIVKETETKVLKLRNSLDKAQGRIRIKRIELDLARSKVLEKYADKNRLISKLIDDKLLDFTAELDSIRGKIEKIMEDKSLKVFDRYKKLKDLEKIYQTKLKVNKKLRNVEISKINRDLDELEKKYELELSSEYAVVEPLEIKLKKSIIDYKKSLDDNDERYQETKSSIVDEIEKLKLSHKISIRDINNNYTGLLSGYEVKFNSYDSKIKKIRNFIDMINRTANQRILVLNQGREISRNDFLSKQKNLEGRINEANEATQEIKDNTEDRKALLLIRKQDIENEIVNLPETEAISKKAEIEVINKQIKALDETVKSVSKANDGIKLVFSKSLESQSMEDRDEQEKYDKETKKIDDKRKSIVRSENQRLKKLSKTYKSLSLKISSIKDEHNNTIKQKEKTYKNELSKLERSMFDLDTGYKKTKSSDSIKYKDTVTKLNKKIEENKRNRKKLLRKKKIESTVLSVKKSKIIRHFDLLRARINSVYESDKRFIDSDILAINQKADKRIAILKGKESEIIDLKNSNESLYQRKVKQYADSKEGSLEKIKLVEEDLDELEKRILKETYDEIKLLKSSRDRSVSKFEKSLFNLEKAQKAFNVFEKAQQRLKSDRKNTSDMISDIMRNFSMLTGDKYTDGSDSEVEIESKGQNMLDKPKVFKDKIFSKNNDIEVLKDVAEEEDFWSGYVSIKGGCFVKDELDNNVEPKRVCVSGFDISNHEVTNEEYRKYKKDHDSGSFKDNTLNENNMPVVNVSWLDAIDYVKWLSKKDSEYAYRLPTDSEWEYAARGGKPGKRFYGEEKNACFYANVADDTVKKRNPNWDVHSCLDGRYVASNVGFYRPNNYGLYDMLGNVWEWTCPVYEKNITGELSCVGTNSPKDDLKVSRGGSWFSSPNSVRFGFKYGNYADFRGKHIGFRLVRYKK